MLAVFNITSMVAGHSITSFAQEDAAPYEAEILIEEENEALEETAEEIVIEDDDEEIIVDEPACLVPAENNESSFQSAESAKSYILNMNIVATDGKTYHVSEV